MKIEDNFLEQKDFNNLQNLLMGSNFAWYYNNIIDYNEDVDKYQFVHTFYIVSDPPLASHFLENLKPILKIIKPLSILAIKANLLTRTSDIVENAFHVDIPQLKDYPEKLKQWTTSIFYVNTNNGYTKFEDGTIVESVANRFVTFPANIKHTGTSCTDQKRRILINFNYYDYEHKIVSA